MARNEAPKSGERDQASNRNGDFIRQSLFRGHLAPAMETPTRCCLDCKARYKGASRRCPYCSEWNNSVTAADYDPSQLGPNGGEICPDCRTELKDYGEMFCCECYFYETKPIPVQCRNCKRPHDCTWTGVYWEFEDRNENDGSCTRTV